MKNKINKLKAKMINKQFLKYNHGNILINGHIDAVHAQSPNSDQYTGEIVEAVINKGNVSGIIATVSRNDMDINRPINDNNAPAIFEFRETINKFLISRSILDKNKQLKKNYLHLAIHGKRDDRKSDFEIGTRNNTSCNQNIKVWFVNELKKISENIGVDKIFPGNYSKSYHRNGDPNSNYQGYGEMFHTIQIEISRTWRKNKQKEIVDFLTNILISFDEKFN